MSDDGETRIGNYIVVVAWAQDFIRAVGSRPKLFRWIFKVMIGRYAWRELVGMYEALIEAGSTPDFEYELKGQRYHKEHPELWGMK